MKLLLYSFIGIMICLCSSKEVKVPCLTEQTQNETRYTVPGTTASDCQYSWINDTKHILAANDDKMNQLVFFSNSTTLVTYDCHERMNYTRNCRSETYQEIGTCIINCKTRSPQKGPDLSRHHWVVIACGVLLCGGVLCCIFMTKHPAEKLISPSSSTSSTSGTPEPALHSLDK